MHLTPEQTIAPEPTSAVREAWEDGYRKQHAVEDSDYAQSVMDAYHAEMARIDACVATSAARGDTNLMQSALAAEMKLAYAQRAMLDWSEKDFVFSAKLEQAWQKFKRDEWPVMWANAVREFNNNRRTALANPSHCGTLEALKRKGKQ